MGRGRARVALSVAGLASAFALPGSAAAAIPPGFADSLVAAVASPTAVAFTPDGRILVTTQPGRLRVVAGGSLLPTPALDLSARACTTSERGLLGVAVDPAFASNRSIYLFYTANAGAQCVNRVSRFTLGNDNVVSPGSEVVLLDGMPSPAGNHNGGDVQFGKDGYLYASVGDGGCDYAGNSGCAGANDAARDEHVLVGKIIRITPEGGIPPANPYTGPGTARCNVTGRTSPGLRCQETFAWGLRNPFRIAFDPNAEGTRFFVNDVGEGTWEEINLGEARADYGWNLREGPCAIHSIHDCGFAAGMTNPIYAYTRATGCASITGGAFVPVGVWPVEYDGDYLFADFVCGKIFRLEPTGGGGYAATEFATGLGVASAVAMTFGPSGSTQALYYTTYAGGGQVRKIEFTGPANRAPTAAISTSPACACGDAPLTVAFDASASSDADGDRLDYAWDLDGDGAFDDSTAVAPSRQYGVGAHTVRVRVSDGRNGTAVASVSVSSGNTAPAIAIAAPAADFRFRVGEPFVLAGNAVDAQDGPLPASALTWRVVRHHGTSHTHPWLAPTSGASVAIDAPVPEDLATAATSFLEVELSATDSHGVTTTARRSIFPRLVDLTFRTAPAGLRVTVAGEQVTGPRLVTSWEGWAFGVAAPTQRDAAGRPWTLGSWSDGGSRSHTVATGASPETYTARFVPAVQLAAIRYDARGPDRRANLNGEWVRVRNVSDEAVALTGWKLRDGDGNVYRFGRFRLEPGRAVTVHTGRGTNGAVRRYWGRGRHVWGNTRGRATLTTNSGALVDVCSYASARRDGSAC